MKAGNLQLRYNQFLIIRYKKFFSSAEIQIIMNIESFNMNECINDHMQNALNYLSVYLFCATLQNRLSSHYSDNLRNSKLHKPI